MALFSGPPTPQPASGLVLLKMFPVTIGFGDATLNLHADGRVEGDIAAWSAALEKAEGWSDLFTVVCWLVLREAERQ